MERILRNRPTRLALAAGLLAVGIWSFLPYLTYRVSSSAFVNAEIVRVTAPISGQVSLPMPGKGHYLDAPLTVSLVEAVAPDRRHLVNLEQQIIVAQRRMDLAQRQIDEIRAADKSLAARAKQHRAAVIERLTRQIEESEGELLACRAEESERRKAWDRVEALAKKGVSSPRQAEEVQATYQGSRARCQAADARVKRLKVERAAAQQEIFLLDGANDAPYSQQQRDRLFLRRQELEAELLRLRMQIVQLEIELDAERRRLERATLYRPTIPPGNVVWSVHASPGSAVVEGEPILDLANCDKRFVAVELPERSFEAISVDDEARVRLLGAQGWMSGRVRQIRGSAAYTDGRLLAANIPEPGHRKITVEVALPPESLPKDGRRFCDIGRLAEVRFDRGRLHLWSGLSTGVKRLAEWFGQPTAHAAEDTPVER